MIRSSALHTLVGIVDGRFKCVLYSGERHRIQIFVTFSVLFSALFIILLGKYDSDTVKWAYGIVGLVVGYWLRRA